MSMADKYNWFHLRALLDALIGAFSNASAGGGAVRILKTRHITYQHMASERYYEFLIKELAKSDL